MKAFLFTIITTLLLAPCLQTKAQVRDINRPSLTSNAKAVQRYADIPVSLYTGTPDITIPLDTLNVFRMSLPMTLSYHCGGVKVDEHPGWTGLGWTLALGGVVTRKVQGMMDELSGGVKVEGYEAGFYYCHNFLKKFEKGWSDAKNFNPKELSGTLNAASTNSFLDMQPDIFSFSVNDLTGFFVMDIDGTWKVYSDRHVEVKGISLGDTPQPTNKVVAHPMKVITKITLADDNGIVYEFGEDAIDMSIDFQNQGRAKWCPTAWHLKRMTHPDGNKIEFSYKREAYNVNINFVQNFSVIKYGNTILYPSETSKPGYVGQLLSPVYLTGVRGSGFAIALYHSESNELDYSKSDYEALMSSAERQDWYYLTGTDGNSDAETLTKRIKWQKLDSVLIKGNKDMLLKKITMCYSDKKTQRLTLNSVNIHCTDGKIGYRYQFDYDNCDKMPQYLSHEKDSWGYYNKNASGTVECSGKFANPETMKYGSLKSITWPTGGKTQFEFEAHTYSRQLPMWGWGGAPFKGEFVAGGLRVKSITDIPADGTQPHTRHYIYNYDGNLPHINTSGILEGNALYFYQSNDGVGFTYGESSTESLLPCSNSLGYNVCYPEVMEISPAGGHTTYKFISLLDMAYQEEAPTYGVTDNPYFLSHTSRARYRGRLTKKAIYDANGNLKAETIINYEKLHGKDEFARCLNYKYETYGNGISVVVTTPYSFTKIYTHNLVESSCVQRDYNDNTQACSEHTSEYKYNVMGQITTTTDIYNDGRSTNLQKRECNIHYAWEHDSIQFKNTGELNHVLSVSHRTNGNQIDSLTNTYGVYSDDKVAKYHYLTEKKYITGGKSSLNTVYRCFKADVLGYPVWTTDSRMVPTVYIWNSCRQCPLAIIKNATYNEVKDKLGADPATVNEETPNILNKINSLRASLPNAFVTTYTYIPHIGITSITDPSGETETYEYDTMLRLCRIRDNNGSKVAEASFSTATAEP